MRKDVGCWNIFWPDMMQMTWLIFVTVAPYPLPDNQLLFLLLLILGGDFVDSCDPLGDSLPGLFD